MGPGKHRRAPVTAPPPAKPAENINTTHVVNKEEALISIITPVYNTVADYLSEAYASLLNQTYSNWEWCLCDDGSTNAITMAALQEINKNPRVKLKTLPKNRGIVKATNTAVSISSADHIAFLDHDDTLEKTALEEVMGAFKNYDTDMVYTDETFVREAEKKNYVHVKPNFSPHYLLSTNYICHLLALKKEKYYEVGRLREGYNGSQDHDLILRVISTTNKIIHIPKPLYNWRIYQGTYSREKGTVDHTKEDVVAAGINAVNSYLYKQNISAKVSSIKRTTHYQISFDMKGTPKVGIIIPTIKNSSTLTTCLSALSKSSYTNFSVFLTGGAIEDSLLTELQNKYDFEITFIEYPHKNYNFAIAMNAAINKIDSEYFILIHDDVFIESNDWIELLIGFAQQENVGAVTGKLYHKDNKITEMGGVVGLDGLATSLFKEMHKDDGGEIDRGLLVQNTSVIHSAMMAFSKKKFLEIEGFCEEYSVNNADFDFCLRLKDSGYHNVIVPHCHAKHFSSKRKLISYERNQVNGLIAKDSNIFIGRYKHLINNGDPYYNPKYKDGDNDTKDLSEILAEQISDKIKQVERTIETVKTNEKIKKRETNPPAQEPKSWKRKSKLVSFIVPWYKHIPVVIPSLLAQTHKTIEILVYHDGVPQEKDKTLISSYQDSRIRFFYTDKNYGDWGHTPRNLAIDKIDPDSFSVVFTGVDNYYLPSFTQELFVPLYRDAKLSSVYCDMLHNNRNWNVFKTILKYGSIDCGCFMARSELAREFRWGNKVDWEDWIFIEKILKKYGANSIKKIPRMLYIHN